MFVLVPTMHHNLYEDVLDLDLVIWIVSCARWTSLVSNAHSVVGVCFCSQGILICIFSPFCLDYPNNPVFTNSHCGI